jgi:DNA polymerase-3 subunit delta'
MAKRVSKKSTKKTTSRSRSSDAPTIPAALIPTKPIGFDRIFGQQRALDTLNAAMDSGRLHHAWIFHGPEGVGKFTTALSWGAMLLDPDLTTDLSGNRVLDPSTETQTLIASGTHPDLFIVRKELARYSKDDRVRGSKLSTIPLDVVKEHVIQPAALAPSIRSGSIASRVFIIDEAELLDRSPTNAPVQNALLKTLEEPAPGTIIILVTSSEDRLLPTIRSRCQRVAFAPLGDDAMNDWARDASIVADPEEHGWLMRTSDGSPGRYVWAHENGMHAWAREVLPALDRALSGNHPIELGSRMTELVDDWAKDWVKKGDKQGENRSKEAANRLGASRMLAMVANHARVSLSDPDRAEHAAHTIELVERAKSELDSNVQMRFAMDHLIASISDPAHAM